MNETQDLRTWLDWNGAEGFDYELREGWIDASTCPDASLKASIETAYMHLKWYKAAVAACQDRYDLLNEAEAYG